MQGLAEVCQNIASFQYRSIDRILLNAYQPVAKLWHRRLAGGFHGQERCFQTAVFPFTTGCYIPTMQTPAAMAVFFREVRRQPILAGKVFKGP